MIYVFCVIWLVLRLNIFSRDSANNRKACISKWNEQLFYFPWENMKYAIYHFYEVLHFVWWFFHSFGSICLLWCRRSCSLFSSILVDVLEFYWNCGFKKMENPLKMNSTHLRVCDVWTHRPVYMEHNSAYRIFSPFSLDLEWEFIQYSKCWISTHLVNVFGCDFYGFTPSK